MKKERTVVTITGVKRVDMVDKWSLMLKEGKVLFGSARVFFSECDLG